MTFEDRISIDTPEGVTLELALAGVGSRFSAAIIDLAIQVGSMLGLAFAAELLGDPGEAVLAVGVFLVFFGYDVVFETWNSGRTPGKIATGLRVVRATGAPIGFLSSAVRNLLRIVDLLPTGYLLGIIAILVTRRNQRLGDLAAGTVVVRERSGGRRSSALVERRPLAVPDGAAGWDVSAVTGEEVATVQRFLDRRGDLPSEARGKLAWELATRLRPKIVGPDASMHPEELLVAIVALKLARQV